jgi:hypothetical protein
MIAWLAGRAVSRAWPGAGAALGWAAGTPRTPGAVTAACMLPAAGEEPVGLADEQPASRKQAQAPSAAAAPVADRRRAAREAVEREMSAVMPIGRRPAWAGSRCQVTSWHRAAAGRSARLAG